MGTINIIEKMADPAFMFYYWKHQIVFLSKHKTGGYKWHFLKELLLNVSVIQEEFCSNSWLPSCVTDRHPHLYTPLLFKQIVSKYQKTEPYDNAVSIYTFSQNGHIRGTWATKLIWINLVLLSFNFASRLQYFE